jgi:hypothetical protein
VSEKTILLVEDDRDQAMRTMLAMRDHGIFEEVDEVVVEEDRAEALDYLFREGAYAGRDGGDPGFSTEKPAHPLNRGCLRSSGAAKPPKRWLLAQVTCRS